MTNMVPVSQKKPTPGGEKTRRSSRQEEALSYEAEIRSLLCQILGLARLDDFDGKADLQAVGLDSINCMELTIEIEIRFAVKIPDEKLGIRYMHSIYDICRLVEEAREDERLQTV